MEELDEIEEFDIHTQHLQCMIHCFVTWKIFNGLHNNNNAIVLCIASRFGVN